ncbi:MAG: 2-oxoacid:acceptor oxidoreductase subunit alpha, partial [Roseibacillus sp.]|nr:2-oxoacid:acceptor oxidoreductase subunit alpha [Roseibacillus sp.]
EAFNEPNLHEHWIEPELDLSERGEDFKPYPVENLTQHAPPGSRMAEGSYPKVTGLEHDEMGHPSGNPVNHQKMTEKRRNKLIALAADLPLSEVYREEDGEILLMGWGSTYGPIREACDRLRDKGLCASATHIRHLHPLPAGLDELLARFEHVFVIEMNDSGVYGHGQLATILRAASCNPAIHSICKTDGLAYRVSEIVDGVDNFLA